VSAIRDIPLGVRPLISTMDNDNESSVACPRDPSLGGGEVDPSFGERSAEMGESASFHAEVTRRVRNPLLRPVPAAVVPASPAPSVVDSVWSDTTKPVAPRIEISGNIHLLSMTPAPIAGSCDPQGAGPTTPWRSGRKGMIIIAAVVVAGAAADLLVWRTIAKRHAAAVLSVTATAAPAALERPATLVATSTAATTLPEIAPLPSPTPAPLPLPPAEAVPALADQEASAAPAMPNAPRDTRSARSLRPSHRKTLVKGTSKSVDDGGMAARPATPRHATRNIDETDPYSP
jgi:hypothetical protein